MLWGATLRSPHPYARIVADRPVGGVGASPASRPSSRPRTCPGRLTYGLISQDQPVFAADMVRYVGEPVAAVAADHPETCRRALEAIVVDLRGARAADRSRGRHRRRPRADPPRRQRAPPPAHRPRRRRRHGRRRRRGHLPRSGCRTRPSSASRRRSRMPDPGAAASSCSSPPSGCTRTASRSPPASACPRSKVRLTLGGVGGAFGAREDISLQVHACLLALRTGRPGEDAVRPGRELPRPRPPPSGHHLDAPPRHRRRPDREDRGPLRARRRRLRVHVVGRARQRHHPRPGAVHGARTPSSTGYAHAHQQPAVRRHAGLRGRAGLLRPRAPDGRAGRGLRARPGRDPPPQRHGDRRPT